MAHAFLVPLAGGDPIPLVKETVVVGRRPEADIRLEVPNVSGRHAELRLQRGHWWVIDLGSANGTKVNGDKIRKKKLSPGDEVIFARTNKFKIEFDPAAAASIAKPKVDSDKDVAFDKPKKWEKAGIRGNRASEKKKAPVDAGTDDLDLFEDVVEKESSFQQSLLEKAGLAKSSKPDIDEDFEDDLQELEELEGLFDEPASKPKKLED